MTRGAVAVAVGDKREAVRELALSTCCGARESVAEKANVLVLADAAIFVRY